MIGKEFSGPVLARVVDLDPESLEEALRELVAAEFIFEQELYPEAIYAFKHPLTQEVAYRSQLGERRSAVHAAVARAIAEQYPERLDEWAALLAQHWESAGEALEAARWNARAAAWAGTQDPTAAQRHWQEGARADRRPARLAGDGGARTLGADLLPELRMAPGHLARGGGGALHRGRADGLEGAGPLVARAPPRRLRPQPVHRRRGGSRVRHARAPGDRAGRGIRRPGALRGHRHLGLRLLPDRRASTRRVAVLDRAIELADGDPTVGAGTLRRLPAGLLLSRSRAHSCARWAGSRRDAS